MACYNNGLPLSQIIATITTRATKLKIAMRLCFAASFDIRFEVVLASVISTTAISIAKICSTVQ